MSYGSQIIQLLNSLVTTWNLALVDLVKLLTTDTFESQEIFDSMKRISDLISVTGATVLIICFLMGEIGNTSNILESRRTESIVKTVFRFLLAQAAVIHAPDIMLTIFSWSKDLTRVVGAGSISLIESLSVPAEIENAIGDLNVFQLIFVWILVFIGMLIGLVLIVMLMLTVYGRLFKIYLYTAVAPIPLATFGSVTTSRVGKGFLKSYCGVCLEALIMLLICVVYSAIINSPEGISFGFLSSGNTDALSLVKDWLLKLIFNMLLLVTMIKGTDRIVREMMGV